jgi:hypothetical protein
LKEWQYALIAANRFAAANSLLPGKLTAMILSRLSGRMTGKAGLSQLGIQTMALSRPRR